MPCTTILVGKKASYDGSTMIARTDDGHFDVKKLITVDPAKQPRKYTSVAGKLTIELPDNPMRYTSSPNVDPKEGVWPATGINECNVGMTATETITTNPRVLGADPMVRYQKAKKRGEKDIPGGIGEEDMCLLVLPYIHTAREGVLRLAELLEKYGTYESNGIAFNDKDEIWWLETIGGHHWMARRVRDEEVVIMPNQFGMDYFDFDDAFGDRENYMCSADMPGFISENHLDLNVLSYEFNPRNVFGSHSDSDHVYNTPRAWYMGRYLAPTTRSWEGNDPDYTPTSDDIPWSFSPERKVTVEDIKYLLSSHYQGTPYDPYLQKDSGKRGIYRSIGINRTGVMAILQIRGYMPKPLQGIEWVCFGPTTFDTVLPVYTAVKQIPEYLSKVSTDVSTDNFYWCSRLLAALADPIFGTAIPMVERYQLSVPAQAHAILKEYDKKIAETGNTALCEEANTKLCEMAKTETQKLLNELVLKASENMKDGYHRWDN